MRILIVHRKRSLPSCLKAQEFYVSDPYGEEALGGEVVSLLGSVKNGEKKAFVIPEESVRIYAPATLSGRPKFSSLLLPAGTAEITLEGKMKRTHGKNYFRLLKRKKKKVKPSLFPFFAALAVSLSIFLVALAFFLQSRSPSAGKTERFTKDGVGSVLLDKTFREIPSEHSLYALTNENGYVYFLPSPPAEGASAEEAAEAFAKIRGVSVRKSGKLILVYCEEEAEMEYYFALYSFYDTEDGVKAVKFLSYAEEKEEWEAKFLTYAASVTFE